MDVLKRNISRFWIITSFSLFLHLAVLPVHAQFSGGGDITRTLPSTSVSPLASEAPVPWGVDAGTIPGVIVGDVMQSPGFLQEKITLPSGESFFFQSMGSSDFSMESFSRFENGGSNDPSGNVVFNQTISDPAFGLNELTVMDGFRQPISIHSDITEKNVASLTEGFNQMDMHFQQIPFVDTATGKVLIRRDIAVWITSFDGVHSDDLDRAESQEELFTLGAGDLSHDVVTSGAGEITYWGDLEVVTIVDPATNQLLNFSRCSDFGDASDRLEDRFFSDNGTRGGCSSGTGSTAVSRPSIPSHDLNDFQLTPINWDRWGGAGFDSMSSGTSTTFPSSP